MNLTEILSPKSYHLPCPFATIRFSFHRSLWPLLLLLLLMPSGLLSFGGVSRLPSALLLCLFFGLALFLQAAAQTFVSRGLGGSPSGVFLLPFGAVLADGLTVRPLNARLRIWAFGAIVNLAFGELLTLSDVEVLHAGGHLILAFGLLSLAPCYPMAGGQILRELFRLRGMDDAGADCQTVEVTRISSCALAILALWNLSVPLLYQLFTVWVIAHRALIPGADLASVKASSFAWFRIRWTLLRQRARRLLTDAFLLSVVSWSLVGQICVAEKQPTKLSQLAATAEAQSQKLRLLETNLVRLEAAFATLDHQFRYVASNELAGLQAAHEHLRESFDAALSRLETLEKTSPKAFNQLHEELERVREEMAGPINRLTTTLKVAADTVRQMETRLATSEASIDQVEREVIRMHQRNEVLSRQLLTFERRLAQERTDADERIREVEYGWVASILIAISAFFFARLLSHHRIQAVEVQLENLLRSRASGADCPVPATEPAILGRQAPADEPSLEAEVKDVSTVSSHAPALSKTWPEDAGSISNGKAENSDHELQESLLSRPIPEPAKVLERLLAISERSRHITKKPIFPRTTPWNLGWACAKGPVRSRNEDFVLTFEIAGCQAVIMADGVGGEPFGGTAAFHASQSAAWSIVRNLGAIAPRPCPKPSTVALNALHAASRGLNRIAAGLGCTHGLRTTLIIVVATPNTYGFAHIGDGKGFVLRATGAHEQFLSPQRSPDDAPNVLTACLGPNMLGSPITGTLARLPGDLLVVGTDGVFSESVELGADFTRNLVRLTFHYQGDLQRATRHLLEECTCAKDEIGFFFDDNLSAALVGTGEAPRLPQGFWMSRDPAQIETAGLGEHCSPAQSFSAPCRDIPVENPHPS